VREAISLTRTRFFFRRGVQSRNRRRAAIADDYLTKPFDMDVLKARSRENSCTVMMMCDIHHFK
jgi:response regulator RpfG family c-di-GMP phosphodiesterase